MSKFTIKRKLKGYEVYQKRFLRQPKRVLTASNIYEVNLFVKYGFEGLNALKSIQDRLVKETTIKVNNNLIDEIESKLKAHENKTGASLDFVRDIIF